MKTFKRSFASLLRTSISTFKRSVGSAIATIATGDTAITIGQCTGLITHPGQLRTHHDCNRFFKWNRVGRERFLVQVGNEDSKASFSYRGNDRCNRCVMMNFQPAFRAPRRTFGCFKTVGNHVDFMHTKALTAPQNGRNIVAPMHGFKNHHNRSQSAFQHGSNPLLSFISDAHSL